MKIRSTPRSKISSSFHDAGKALLRTPGFIFVILTQFSNFPEGQRAGSSWLVSSDTQ